MDIVTLGELLIDMFPADVGVRLTEVTAFNPKPGGAPANVAVAARRLGAETAFIGKVGNDLFGDFLRDTLKAEGVDVRGIRFDPEARTTMAVIAKPDENSAEFVFYRNPGADQRLRAAELDRDLLENAKAFHFGSLSLTDEPAAGATMEAIQIARNAGAFVSYDVNYRPSLWSSPRIALAMARAMLSQVDLLKVSEGELLLLASPELGDGPSSAEMIKQATEVLTNLGPSVVVVTFGQRGSAFRVAGEYHLVPSFPVETVDSVGCGDTFIGAVLTRIVQDFADWHDALTVEALRGIVRYANAAAALTATRQGVIPALPTRDEVAAFLQKHE